MRHDKYKNRAQTIIKSLPDAVKEEYVKKKEANHRVVYYVLLEALKNRNSRFILAIIENQFIPIKFILKIAREGTTRLLDMMINFKEKLIAYPEIMSVMEKNPIITPLQKKKIQELKKAYLIEFPVHKVPREMVFREIDDLTKLDRGIVGKNKKIPSKSEIRKKISATLERVNKMNLSQKIKLAFEGNIWQRVILARCNEELITLALLENPGIEVGEVIRLLETRNIGKNVILKISRNPQWINKEKICLYLIKNTECPRTVAVGIINRFSVPVLQKLSKLKTTPKEINKLILEILKKKKR